jgi:hypothetical protein
LQTASRAIGWLADKSCAVVDHEPDGEGLARALFGTPVSTTSGAW